MQRYVTIILFVIVFFMPSVSVWADEVRLKNGDVLTGKVVRKETGKLIFKTSYAGEVGIIWTQIASLRSDEPLRIVMSDDSNLKGRIVPAGSGKANVTTEEDEDVAQIDLNKILYINPSAEVAAAGITWEGNINLGGAFTKGNSDTGLLNFNAESVIRRKKDRFTLGAIVNRAKSEGEETQFNSRGLAKYDYFLSRQWYAYVNASAEHDRFRDVRLRTSTGAGSGYQVFERPDLKLSLEGGLNYITVDYYFDEDESYPGGRWAIKYDQKILGGDTEIFHRHEFLFGFLNGENTLFFSQTGLRVPIAENLNASTQLNVDWAKSPPPGRKSTDASLIFSLGYGW